MMQIEALDYRSASFSEAKSGIFAYQERVYEILFLIDGS